LGIGGHNLRRTLALGLVFAGVQFSITLWGFSLPRPVDWVPLLIMALTVGLFWYRRRHPVRVPNAAPAAGGGPDVVACWKLVKGRRLRLS
jgi:hypothetical protein